MESASEMEANKEDTSDDDRIPSLISGYIKPRVQVKRIEMSKYDRKKVWGHSLD